MPERGKEARSRFNPNHQNKYELINRSFLIVPGENDFPFSSQLCSCRLLRFKKKPHLVSVRKTSWFGLKHQVLVATFTDWDGYNFLWKIGGFYQRAPNSSSGLRSLGGTIMKLGDSNRDVSVCSEDRSCCLSSLAGLHHRLVQLNYSFLFLNWTSEPQGQFLMSHEQIKCSWK